MKFLVTGVSGQLGYDVLLELNKRYPDAEVIAPDHELLDITNHDETVRYINNIKPDVIFHCAAYTKVDKAESDCKTCYDVNVNGTKNIVLGAKLTGAKLIYVSTDYVFDGTKDFYHTYDETRPINVYGQTKLLGEQAALEYPKSFVVRTSWVFGLHGNGNFVKTMLRLSETKKEITVVEDQIGSPTYSSDLARLLVDLAETEQYGIYHGSNEGYTSWYEFAKYIFEVAGIDMEVLPVKTKDYKTDAARPLKTCLDKSDITKIGLAPLPHWQDAVRRYIGEIPKNVKIRKVEKED